MISADFGVGIWWADCRFVNAGVGVVVFYLDCVRWFSNCECFGVWVDVMGLVLGTGLLCGC